jgi:flagellin-specific chaperone FliS
LGSTTLYNFSSKRHFKAKTCKSLWDKIERLAKRIARTWDKVYKIYKEVREIEDDLMSRIDALRQESV